MSLDVFGKKNSRFFTMFRSIPTLEVIYVTSADMNPFPNFLCNIWPKLVQDGAVCVSSTSDWQDSYDTSQPYLIITAREQAMPYPPFTSTIAHEKILRCKKKSILQAELKIRNDQGHLRDMAFVGWERVQKVDQHCLLANRIEANCRLELRSIKTFLASERWSKWMRHCKTRFSFGT